MDIESVLLARGGLATTADLLASQPIVDCMGAAAALYGFDTENASRTQILDPAAAMRRDNDSDDGQ